jgi:hypothetical protein
VLVEGGENSLGERSSPGGAGVVSWGLLSGRGRDNTERHGLGCLRLQGSPPGRFTPTAQPCCESSLGEIVALGGCQSGVSGRYWVGDRSEGRLSGTVGLSLEAFNCA